MSRRITMQLTNPQLRAAVNKMHELLRQHPPTGAKALDYLNAHVADKRARARLKVAVMVLKHLEERRRNLSEVRLAILWQDGPDDPGTVELQFLRFGKREGSGGFNGN